MQVSVVIPAINEANNIETAINSCFDALADEVIVVDGGSTDQTAEIARQLGCRVVISTPGRGVQQNRGAENASGDYLLFLHADCILHSDCIRQIKTLALTDHEAFGGFRQQIDERQRIYRWLEWGNGIRLRYFRLLYGDQAIFLPAKTFSAIEGFPEEPFMEDVILSRRLREWGRPHLLLGPVRVGSRRWKAGGPIRQTFRNWNLLLSFFCGASPQALSERYRRHDQPRCPPDRDNEAGMIK